MVSLLLVANIFNLGADIGAMGAAAKLFLPGPVWAYILLLGGVSLLLQIAVPYTKYVPYLKWLTLALFAYIATAIVVGEPRWQAIRATFWPSIRWNSDLATAASNAPKPASSVPSTIRAGYIAARANATTSASASTQASAGTVRKN